MRSATRETTTYCRICSPQCGLIATVEDGKLVSVRGDRDHVHSQGFLCAKAAGAIEVTYDPDRVLAPLRRVGAPGEFEPVSWDVALDDIASRLRTIRSAHGNESFATFLGNPPLYGFATALWLSGFQAALEVKWRYSINSEDASARKAANALLYGSAAYNPKPDLWRTSFAVLIGANPVVSHGSLVTEARFRDALTSVVERGGRVVVIDPRRTETARQFEHVPLRAGEDAYLLLAILHVLVTEQLCDLDFIAAHTSGFEVLTELVSRYDVERCARRCHVPADTIRELARSFAAAPSALVYGRTGTCTQRFGTLNNMLQDLVMIVTGNFDRAGGMVFGWSFLESFSKRAGFASYGKVRTRTTDLPDVFGMLPSTALATDITVPGAGQVRALMTLGGNPVLSSAGGGERLEAALEALDLHFSLDIYVNETNKHADYILPVPTMYEREDFPLGVAGNMLRPSIWATPAVVEPRGDTRPEWRILNAIAKRMGYGGAYASPRLRRLARFGFSRRPRTMLDRLVRTSSIGDRYGLRPSGLSFRKLIRRYPHGKQLRDDLPSRELDRYLLTADKRIPLAVEQLISELDRLDAHATDHDLDEGFPLRLTGMREVRSQNTWMHNVERLMPEGRRLAARVNPHDAEAAGLVDGQEAIVTSRSGSVRVAVAVTADMSPGNVALPHGWGHAGGWQRANAAGGVNSNELASPLVEDLEVLAGMSILNGIPIRIEPCDVTDELHPTSTNKQASRY